MDFCRFLRSVKFVVRVAAFFEKKLAHFLAFVVKVGVVNADASQSEELREWDGIF